MVPFYWRRLGVLKKLSDTLRSIEGYGPTCLLLEHLTMPGLRDMAEGLGVLRWARLQPRQYVPHTNLLGADSGMECHLEIRGMYLRLPWDANQETQYVLTYNSKVQQVLPVSAFRFLCLQCPCISLFWLISTCASGSP